MVAPVISSLPVAPQRTDLPATFSDRADAFVAALQPFRNQLNDALAWQNLTFEATDQALNQANQARNAAQTSASNAEQSNQESQAAKDLSQQWAESDDPVEGGRSSKYWKEQAEVVAAAVQSAAGLPSLTGNARNVLTVAPGEDGVEWQPGIQSLYTEFTESGTFTPDPRARWVYVECVGGGASGGANVGSGGARAGGEGGHVSYKLIRLSDIPTSVPVTVGAGGAPVTSTGSMEVGIVGGDSSFGDLVFAFGGVASDGNSRSTREGSVSPCTGGAGGGSRAVDSLPAGPGSSALGGGGGGASVSSYREGGESFGGNGRGGDGALTSSSGSAEDGEFPGGGGGGIFVDASEGTATSGAGGDGIVRIWQW